jgi:2-polyprenyl-6-methoxyphenol hydroxylase-like FAD-dependent oxidoreductase
MTSVRTVLVVGGGTAGCTLAALLARAGVAVEIVERNPNFIALGSGITLQGAALRVLEQVGVLDELLGHGARFDEITLRSADGRVLARNPTPPTMGAYRPKLAELLAAAAVDAGVKVRLGASVESFVQDDDGVDVVFSDGDTGRYDLLVAADGVRSTTRARMGIEAEIKSVGMGIWRVHARRPAEVEHSELVYDGPCYIAGFTPTGPDTLYAYLVEPAQNRFSDSPEQKVAEMRELAADYHGPWDEIRADIIDPDRINYTWFEHLLIEGPWNRGRAVVIGDAAHVCPPTLALGAAMAMEDAAVLAELLISRDRLDQDLFDTFLTRRLPRAKAVIDGSMQLATWLLERDADADVPGLMARIYGLLNEPA